MATRYRFDRDYDHPVRPSVDIAYKAGQEVIIPDAHAVAADQAGAGTRLPREAPERGTGQTFEADAARG